MALVFFYKGCSKMFGGVIFFFLIEYSSTSRGETLSVPKCPCVFMLCLGPFETCYKENLSKMKFI